MPVQVRVENGPFPAVSGSRVRRWAERMLSELGLQGCELSILLTDDAAIRELNRSFREVDRPTDVLAFAMREGHPSPPPRSRELLGDVIVSIPTARRQAARRRKTVQSELQMLVAHGLLHLIGYDHQTLEEARRMGAMTRTLCRAAAPRGDHRHPDPKSHE